MKELGGGEIAIFGFEVIRELCLLRHESPSDGLVARIPLLTDVENGGL